MAIQNSGLRTRHLLQLNQISTWPAGKNQKFNHAQMGDTL